MADRNASIDEKTAEAFGRAVARELGKKSWQDEVLTYRNAEKGMSAFEIKAGAEPAFFPFIDSEAQAEWKARATLVTAAAIKKNAPSYDKLFPNDAAISLSKEDLKRLLDKEGAKEALSVYVAVLNTDPDLKLLFDDDSLPSSFYEIKDETTLMKVRDNMKEYIKSRFVHKQHKEWEDPSTDAEHIAWNLLYLSNTVEWNDSAFNGRAQGSSRMPPIPGLKSVAVWMMMHPEERLSAKIGGDESWGALGEWALDNMKKDPNWTPAKEDILPDIMFPTMFHEVKATDKKNLYDFLSEQGVKLIREIDDFVEDVEWNNVRENPFSGYYFDQISPAIAIFTILDRGETDKKLKDVGTACRKLSLSTKYRETVLLAWEGVDSRSKALKMVRGNIAWNLYKQSVKKYAPNFFD